MVPFTDEMYKDSYITDHLLMEYNRISFVRLMTLLNKETLTEVDVLIRYFINILIFRFIDVEIYIYIIPL